MRCEIIDVEQGSEEWLQVRKGMITGSKITACFTSKGAISKAGIKTTAREIIADIHAIDEDSFKSKWMERGNELEGSARSVAAFLLNKKIDEVGFCKVEGTNYGISPDGLVLDENVGVEFKCPMAKTHIKYLDENVLPSEYAYQVHYSMFVTGYKEWVFCSYYPEMRPLVLSIKFDKEINEKIKECLNLLNEEIERLELMIG